MTDRLRICVFGGRDYAHAGRVRVALARVYDERGPFTLVTGACPTGADAHADAWAREAIDALGYSLVIVRHPADWRKHGRRAGPLRNQAMVDSGLDGAIQFPGGRGTADMRRRLDAAGVPVWEPAS